MYERQFHLFCSFRKSIVSIFVRIKSLEFLLTYVQHHSLERSIMLTYNWGRKEITLPIGMMKETILKTRTTPISIYHSHRLHSAKEKYAKLSPFSNHTWTSKKTCHQDAQILFIISQFALHYTGKEFRIKRFKKAISC